MKKEPAPPKYVCARCGCNIGFWHFGWKHQTGWRSKLKPCGQKPIPKEKV